MTTLETIVVIIISAFVGISTIFFIVNAIRDGIELLKDIRENEG